MAIKKYLTSNNHLEKWKTGLVVAALILGSFLLFMYCREAGIQHDYTRYVAQWQLVLDGAPPWSTDNAYGPLHTLLAFLLPFGRIKPKYFMVGLMLLANALLALELYRERGFQKIQLVYLLAIPTNILFIGIGILYGLNDALVAAFLVFAVLLRRCKHPLAAGAMIALAGLVKYYPLALLPFFALDKRKINWPVIVSGALVFIGGFAVSLAVWGQGPLTAILFNTTRVPKLLSILASLQSVFGEAGVTGFLIQYNVIIMGLGVALALLFAWLNRLNWLEGALLGYLVMLMLYKVGNQQFYLPVLFMVACLPLMNRKPADRMAVSLIPLVLFLSLYQYGYQFASDSYHNEMSWVRAYGGFAAFVINLASITAVCLIARKEKEMD
jgi:uncharacterized membrane protein